MAEMAWVVTTRDKIYTAVKVRAERNLKTAYPSIRFTQDDSASLATEFPTVYIRFLPGRQMGQNIEADGVNAFQCDVEVEVTVSKAQGKTTAFKVAEEVAEQFAAYRFSYRAVPTVNPVGNDTKQVIFRMSRAIADGDVI